MQDESGIHLHCLSCYKMNCTSFLNCEINYCPNQCGVKYHQCKQTEHMHVCRKHKRPCVNNKNGCPFKLDSIAMIAHLEYCPASVLHCGMNWNRYPLYSKIREEWLPFWQGNPVQVEGDLDLEFAISDQLNLDREMEKRIKKGSRHVPDCKKNIQKISKQRIKELESLLFNHHTKPKMSFKYKKSQVVNGINSNSHTIIKAEENFTDVKSEQINEQENDDIENNDQEEEFVTYDQVASDLSTNTATVVSNTNIRLAYYDLPNKYIDGVGQKFDILTRSESTEKKDTGNTSNDISSDQVNLRMKLYADLKMTYFPLGLNAVIETMPKFQNQYPMYSFSCSKVFRRDQYKWHCKNMHLDIQPHVNGWLFERCPLSQYGCPFTQNRLKPKNKHIRFSKTFSTFYSAMDSHKLDEDYKSLNNQDNDISLLELPQEVVEYIFTFLDNLSLNCVAKTCRYLRSVCYELLDNHGVVITSWKKKNYKNLGVSWKEQKQVRFFTTSCSPMKTFQFTDVPHIGNHLQTCVFNTRRTFYNEKVFLIDKNALVGTRVKPKVYQWRPVEYYQWSTSAVEY